MAKNVIIGIVTEVFQPEANGQFVSQSFLIEKLGDNYHRQIRMTLRSQSTIDKVQPVVGMIGEFSFEPTSYQGKQSGVWHDQTVCYDFRDVSQIQAIQQGRTDQIQNQTQAQPQYAVPQAPQPQQNYGGGYNPQGGWQPQGGGGWTPQN